MHAVKIKMLITHKLTIIIALIIAIQIHSIRTENMQIQQLNNNLKENILSGNSSKLNELAPQYNKYTHELVAYNQLLPYLYSKLPIPVSLINQLRKYNINKNMLNKLYNYNKLRRDLHNKLIENEIKGYKYSDILSKKLQLLFKSVSQEEKKNFLNLVNYMKMFNLDNNKLYNSLNEANDLLKLINNNKIKYLPFINTDKTLPDIFTNNKVNKEIRRILIQYKISSKDLYDRLIKKINPYLIEGLRKNNLAHDANNEYAEVEDMKANNPYELLKERIEDLTSFRKNPKILPLNEKIQINKHDNENLNIQKNDVAKKDIDELLNKYIKDLRLMNEIEKEREELLNSKMDKFINLNKNNEKVTVTQPKPCSELLALYIVLSIPGLLSVVPSKNKRLPYIKRTKEDILQRSHIEAGKLYNKLANKNLKERLNNIPDMIKRGKANIDNIWGTELAEKKIKDNIEMRYHPFGNQESQKLVSDNDYYDPPRMPEYGSQQINYKRENLINGADLYSALRNKISFNAMKFGDDVHKMGGNHIFNDLVNGPSENVLENEIDSKVHVLKMNAQDIEPHQNVIQDYKIGGQTLFEKFVGKGNSDGWKEDTIYSQKNNKGNPSKIKFIDGKVPFNIWKNNNLGISPKAHNELEKDMDHKIEGQKLFNLLDPTGSEYKVMVLKEDVPKVNMNKFYQRLYQEFMKDNSGTLNKMETKVNKNKVEWHNHNVEIPNISAVDMTENKKPYMAKADENEINDQKGNSSNDAPKG